MPTRPGQSRQLLIGQTGSAGRRFGWGNLSQETMAEISDKHLDRIKNLINEANLALAAAEELMISILGEDIKKAAGGTGSGTEVARVIEGMFNGQNMVGDDNKVYPVQANYASKSQLVEGDRMKLTIDSGGAFLFKQIGPVDRNQVVGVLSQQEGHYYVKVEDRLYQVLLASVTHHKIRIGDQVSVDIPSANPEAHWAAIKAPL